MRNLARFCLLVALAVLVYQRQDAVRGFLVRLSARVQSATGTLAGKATVDLGQLAKRELLQGNLWRAMRQYHAMRDQDPRSLDDLVREGLLQKADLLDEWGRSLQVEVGSRGLVIRGLGADARPRTADDWTLGP